MSLFHRDYLRNALLCVQTHCKILHTVTELETHPQNLRIYSMYQNVAKKRDIFTKNIFYLQEDLIRDWIQLLANMVSAAETTSASCHGISKRYSASVTQKSNIFNRQKLMQHFG